MAAIVALSAISVPVVLVTASAAIAAPAAGTAARLVAQPSGGVAVTITGMTPREAGPGSTITVTGTLKNTSQQQQSQLAIRLLSSSTPVSTVPDIEAGASDPYLLANTQLPGGSWQTTGQLAPGAVVLWSIHVKAKAIGMTTFGVYPLVAQAQPTLTDQSPAAAITYLPYVPAKKGQYGSTIPARTKISWVWPLMDKPLLTASGPNTCPGGQQAQALAASLGSGGRLGQLVQAGANGSRAAITWAIDPALLADVKALSACGSLHPKWAAVARSWLAKLRQVSSAQPVFFAPYGNPDVSALIDAEHYNDVKIAFQQGRSIGGKILRRNASAGPAARRPATQGGTASIAWPAGGIPRDTPQDEAGLSVLENLSSDGVQTLLLGSSYLPSERATVLRTPDNGGYMNLLLANDSLTRLLGPAGGAADSAFATSQKFLAETALLAKQSRGQPIVVAPPPIWTPVPHLGANLLAMTTSATWLNPVSLTSLANGKNIQLLKRLPSGHRHRMLSHIQAKVLRQADNTIAQLAALKASRNTAEDYLPLLAAESSAWQGSRKAGLGALRALDQRIRRQLSQGVRIEAEQRFTLGGLKGSVPVSIDNTLSYAVAVRLGINFSQNSGIAITVSPGGAVNQHGLVTIPPHDVVTVHLRVQATKVGATLVTLGLANRTGMALFHSPTQQMTIQATQVGVLGVIIFAVALGIFLIATAARAARRGRVAPAAEQATDSGLATEQAVDRPAAPPEPDTVMAERTELGAAGTPGRD